MSRNFLFRKKLKSLYVDQVQVGCLPSHCPRLWKKRGKCGTATEGCRQGPAHGLIRTTHNFIITIIISSDSVFKIKNNY